ncbi:hypothetical protein M8J76_005750 [Diaphorina citri]|nr:hypothetical protein M8J76_005750 [Diaphorina citri]
MNIKTKIIKPTKTKQTSSNLNLGEKNELGEVNLKQTDNKSDKITKSNKTKQDGKKTKNLENSTLDNFINYDEDQHLTHDALKVPNSSQTGQVIDKHNSVIIPSSSSHAHSETDSQAWIHARDGYIEKIRQQEIEIIDLKNQIKSLEYLVQSLTNNRSNVSQPGHGQTIGAGANDTKDIITSCYIIGDSQVRGICDNVMQLLPNSCKIEAFCQPGAGFKEVAQTHVTSPGLIQPNLDSIVIMCGTNDVCITPWEIIKKALDDLTSRFQDCKQVIMIGVSLRFDRKKLNFHIHRFNTKIKKYVQNRFKCENVSFINPSQFLKPRDYSVDGLHLNKTGKEKLSHRIRNNIIKCFSLQNTCFQIKPHTNPCRDYNEMVDLIDLTEPPLVNLSEVEPPHTNTGLLPNFDESTFSPDSPNYCVMFPNLTPSPRSKSKPRNSVPIPLINTNQSLLDTPNIPDHVQEIISGETHRSDYYRITNISQFSFSKCPSYSSSPIPTISPGYNRPLNKEQSEGFRDQGHPSET